MTAVRENGATSGLGVLAIYAYDDRGRRTSATFGNGASISYGYDAVDRLSSLAHDFSSTTYDVTSTYSYNPAGQIASMTRSNDLYASGFANNNVTDTQNGLNQITQTRSTSVSHDSRGNTTAVGSTSYSYNSENVLASAGSTTMSYDPLRRAYEFSGGTHWLYDGWDLAAEYTGAGALIRRTVFGPDGEPIATLVPISGTTTRFWYHGDERGSFIGDSKENGSFDTSVPTRYDEYGRQNGAFSIFGLAGARYMPGTALLYMRNRNYDEERGRFLQADPIGFGGGMNLYSYVQNDPANYTDPLGFGVCIGTNEHGCVDVLVSGSSGASGGSGGSVGGGSVSGRIQVRMPIAYGGGGGASDGPPLCLATPPSIPLSPETTSRAVNQALAEALGSSEFPRARSLSREFARLDTSPDFSRGGWIPTYSGHAENSWDLRIPHSGYVVKVYVNDRAAGGGITSAITTYTNTPIHWGQAAVNEIFHYVGNAQRAREYLESRRPCK